MLVALRCHRATLLRRFRFPPPVEGAAGESELVARLVVPVVPVVVRAAAVFPAALQLPVRETLAVPPHQWRTLVARAAVERPLREQARALPQTLVAAARAVLGSNLALLLARPFRFKAPALLGVAVGLRVVVELRLLLTGAAPTSAGNETESLIERVAVRDELSREAEQDLAVRVVPVWSTFVTGSHNGSLREGRGRDRHVRTGRP